MIEFQQVYFSYDAPVKKRRLSKKKQADASAIDQDAWTLKNISLTIADGSFVGIAGHTGSGKSTLIQHMNGLLSPQKGKVLVDGIDLASKKEGFDARHKVGLVFQFPERQLFAQSVFEDVAFGPRNLGLSEEEVKHASEKALEQVGINPEEVGSLSPFELSGGQQRRVALAGILAMHPKTLVLDEPCAGLDPHARKSFLALIEKLHEQGITIVLVSHSMEDLAHYAKHIVVLNNGEICMQGSPQEVFLHAEVLQEIGLDVPAPVRVANTLRTSGVDIPKQLYTQTSLAQEIVRAYGAHSAGENSCTQKTSQPGAQTRIQPQPGKQTCIQSCTQGSTERSPRK